jgi:hypothetical protein
LDVSTIPGPDANQIVNSVSIKIAGHNLSGAGDNPGLLPRCGIPPVDMRIPHANQVVFGVAIHLSFGNAIGP